MNIRRLVGVLLILGATVAGAVDAEIQAYLKEHPADCPKKVILKAPVAFSLTMNGKVIGSMTKPAQTEVDVVSFRDPQVELLSGNGKATVVAAQTDLWERVEQARVKAAQVTTLSLPAASDPAPVAAVTPVAAMVGTAPTPAKPVGEPSTHESEISPKANFTKADFRLRLLDSRPVKGVLVLVPGLDGDGRGAVEDQRWQAVANDFDLALVGCFMQGGGYHQAENGTGEALLDALKDFAKKSNHPELNTVPLVMWGHSAGGQYNYNFVSWKPQRVAAFVVNKGGYYSGTPNAQSRKVPGIFFLGEKDSDLRVKNITDIYEKGRKLGALWALAPEPNSGHEQGNTPVVAEAFFRAVLPQRLASAGKLSDMDERKGWLASPEKKIIEPAATSSLGKSDAGWLPDEDTARAWLKFVGGN